MCFRDDPVPRAKQSSLTSSLRLRSTMPQPGHAVHPSGLSQAFPLSQQWGRQISHFMFSQTDGFFPTLLPRPPNLYMTCRRFNDNLVNNLSPDFDFGRIVGSPALRMFPRVHGATSPRSNTVNPPRIKQAFSVGPKWMTVKPPACDHPTTAGLVMRGSLPSLPARHAQPLLLELAHLGFGPMFVPSSSSTLLLCNPHAGPRENLQRPSQSDGVVDSIRPKNCRHASNRALA
jgi:hypothetical protein